MFNPVRGLEYFPRLLWIFILFLRTECLSILIPTARLGGSEALVFFKNMTLNIRCSSYDKTTLQVVRINGMETKPCDNQKVHPAHFYWIGPVQYYCKGRS